MFWTAIVLGVKYGPPLVAALFSVLAHHKGKQNHQALIDLTDSVKAQNVTAKV